MLEGTPLPAQPYSLTPSRFQLAELLHRRNLIRNALAHLDFLFVTRFSQQALVGRLAVSIKCFVRRSPACSTIQGILGSSIEIFTFKRLSRPILITRICSSIEGLLAQSRRCFVTRKLAMLPAMSAAAGYESQRRAGQSGLAFGPS